MADYVRRPNDKIVKLIDDFVRRTGGRRGRVDMYSRPILHRDQYFVLDRLPSHEEVTLFTGDVAAPKFAPLLGKLLAEALGMAPSHDIAPFPPRGVRAVAKGEGHGLTNRRSWLSFLFFLFLY